MGFLLLFGVSKHQKKKNSLLNSLLIAKNRENPPSANHRLRFSGNYRWYERWCGASVAKRCCKSLILRRISARNTRNRNREDVVAEEVGFEPTVDFHLRRFSRPVHSTTLPLLRPASNSCTRLILKEPILNKTNFRSQKGSKSISWRHLTPKPSLPWDVYTCAVQK